MARIGMNEPSLQAYAVIDRNVELLGPKTKQFWGGIALDGIDDFSVCNAVWLDWRIWKYMFDDDIKSKRSNDDDRTASEEDPLDHFLHTPSVDKGNDGYNDCCYHVGH